MKMSEAFNWDAIPVKSGATADPAAGANPVALTIPAGKKWLFLGGRNTIVCSADAANRQPILDVRVDGTNQTWYIRSGDVFIATDSGQVEILCGQQSREVLDRVAHVIGIPAMGLELPAGATIQMTYVNIQAADNCGVFYYAYKEAPA